MTDAMNAETPGEAGLACKKCGAGDHWTLACPTPEAPATEPATAPGAAATDSLTSSTSTNGTSASGRRVRLTKECGGIAEAMDQVMEACQDISMAIEHIDANA